MGTQPIRVLKFGSSVLSNRRDLSLVLHEIYRELRDGARVVAVVSAVGRTTNRLLASARRMGPRPDAAPLALLLATGETQAVAQLALALDRGGIAAAVLDPAQIGLTTKGPLLDADPIGLNADVVRRALSEVSVVVIPGFVGRDEAGRTSLLGRGGSDLSALFLAQRLGASCRLVKDVPGVFDRDPALHGLAARRYAELPWDGALKVGGRIVQEKALRFAREHQLEFEVGTLESTDSTLVGRGPASFAPARAARRKLRVALLGLGTVGLGVYRELARFPDRFDVETILVRRTGLGRPSNVAPDLVTTDLDRVRSCACDVIVEVLGGAQPAGELIEDALRRGIDVVSANKGLIVERGEQFGSLAARSGARFLYSASVCGALPLLEVVRKVARERRIVAIEGVLNSTTNVVLDLMGQGRGFEDALAQARRRGFCERDPRQDLDGTDAAHKLALVAREAFDSGLRTRWIEREGIAKLQPAEVREAWQRDQRVRLVAACRRTESGLESSLAPRCLNRDHPLAPTSAEENAVVIHTERGAPVLLRGRGAGRWPTTQSVVGDLLELSRRHEQESIEAPSSLERAAAC